MALRASQREPYADDMSSPYGVQVGWDASPGGPFLSLGMCTHLSILLLCHHVSLTFSSIHWVSSSMQWPQVSYLHEDTHEQRMGFGCGLLPPLCTWLQTEKVVGL